MTTDSYVVKPLFFPGGDIGKLAVCGTINDLAVAGARPVALSLALIMEEGFPIASLERILDSIGRTAAENQRPVVTGDTKTVEAGSADGLFINTTGVGVKRQGVDLGFDRIAPGDRVILSGTIGDHGMTILSQRQDIGFQTPVAERLCGPGGGDRPDARCLWRTDQIHAGPDPRRPGRHTQRDRARPRGGRSRWRKSQVPVNPAVRAAADMLGLDVFNVANEGKFVAVVAPEAADRCLELCRRHPLGRQAAIIGQVKAAVQVPVVEMVTRIGGRRIVQMPYGRDLPRIC